MNLTRYRGPNLLQQPTQNPLPPDQLHPAAAETAVRFSEAITKADRLEHELSELRVAERTKTNQIALLQQRLDQSEEHRRVLERYAIELKSNLDTILNVITSAQQRAVKFASVPAPRETERIEEAVGEVVDEIKKAREAGE